MFHYSLRVIDEPKMSKSNFVLVPTVGRYLRKAALKNNSVHRRRLKWLCLRCRDCSHCQTIWGNRPLNLSKNVETLNHSTWPPESVVFSSHDKLDGRREKGGDEKQWTAEEFWEIQNGGLLLRFPFFGNFRDYNHGNVYTWYSHRFKHKPKRGCCLSWLCLCWDVFMQIHEINPTGKFPKRPWNLWKASTVHEQSKHWQYWSGFFDSDRKGAIYGEKGQL